MSTTTVQCGLLPGKHFNTRNVARRVVSTPTQLDSDDR